MSNVVVVKFGGSCLATPQNVLAAAKKIEPEAKKGTRIVVVVSALMGVTDSLIKAAQESTVSGGVDGKDLDEILSMGERISARLMASSLRSVGLKAVEVDPTSDLWPIATNANYGNAEVDMTKTRALVKERIQPLLKEGVVPVVPGFIGRSPEEHVTTLGRGGSDITAVVLGSCLDAEEVVFVKDVNGVLSADPKQVSDPLRIESMDAEEAFHLTMAGAKILHPKALRYKARSMMLRVVGFGEAGLKGGTVIKGVLDLRLEACIHTNPLTMVTLVGQEIYAPQAISKILGEASGASVGLMGATISSSSLLLYIENPKDLVPKLHELIKRDGVAKAIHSHHSLAMIVIGGPELETFPGIMEAVAQPLSESGINIYGVFTISSSIRIFVPWKDGERALNLINLNLKDLSGKVNGI